MLQLLLLSALLLAAHPAAAAKAKLAVGDAPPEQVGVSPGGQKLNLQDMRGRVVVTIWARWCGPCLKELPLLDAIQREVGDEHLRIVAINYAEDRDKFNKIRRVLRETVLTLAFDSAGLRPAGMA